MDCSGAAIGLLLVAVGGLALAAFLRSRDNATALAGLRAETARLRDLVHAAQSAAALRGSSRTGREVETAAHHAGGQDAAMPEAALRAIEPGEAARFGVPQPATHPQAMPQPATHLQAMPPTGTLPAGAMATGAPLRETTRPAMPAPPTGRAATLAPGSLVPEAADSLGSLPGSLVPGSLVPGSPLSGTLPPVSPPPGSPSPPAAAAPPGRLPVPAVAVMAPGAGGAPAGGAAAAAAPKRISFEELVGARLLVWVGAMALALAGAFLVKFSFDRGWISPPVRVATGVAFGVGMLALAEWSRRSSARISAALAAAGIADLFACFLAAVHVYHLVPPAAGFLLMGLTTAVAVALSLRQGAMVALIGLVGGFLTPALIQTAQPSARNLFGYLLLLTGGLLAVAWRRRWRWLAVAALVASLFWAAVWLADSVNSGDLTWLSLFLIALAVGATLPPLAAGAADAISRPPTTAGGPLQGVLRMATTGAATAGSIALPGVVPLATDATAPWHEKAAPLAAIAAAVALQAGTVARGGFSIAEWGFLGLLAAGVLALAWLDPRYLPLAWVAEATTLVVLAGWGSRLDPASVDRFLGIALAAGGLFAVAGWAGALAGPPSWRRPPGWLGWEDSEWPGPGGSVPLGSGGSVPLGQAGSGRLGSAGSGSLGSDGSGPLGQAGSESLGSDDPGPLRSGGSAGLVAPAHCPGVWAALSATAGVAFFVVTWAAAHTASGLSAEAWGSLALAAAALYLASALPVERRRRTRPELTPALAALAVAVTSLVSISVPLALSRDSFAAAWALEAAALVWLARRFHLPALVVLARLLAATAVLGALFSDAGEQARGQLPLLNELLYAYGVPLLALAGTAWMARREGSLQNRPAPALISPLRLAAELEWEATALGLVLVTLEIHQAFQPAAAPPGIAGTSAGLTWIGLTEWAALACAWLLLGRALLRANRRPALASLELSGRLVMLAGLAIALAGPCVAANPLWNHRPVGEAPLLNLLAAAYALPALLALAGAAEVRRRGGRKLPLLAGGAALLLGFVWISLTVRQLFHGTFLDAGPTGAAERYAYSAAWVLYGVGLLLTGIARRGPLLRYASLAVMLLAVGKAFLYDAARLSDLYRVLSFLGLGASLLLLGFLYQRFVFREGRP